jgi:ring-1,2-phenylacetyl-CoA epoxidase subunit PaaC
VTPDLRPEGAFREFEINRHCERSEAIHLAAERKNGLLAPRNDEQRANGLMNMAVASISVAETPMVLYALRRADDALILGHRLSEWCGHAPAMEEDMALANMGLDLLGQARELYSYAAKVEGKGHDEDKFAYLRDVRQYRNLLLLEQPNGDFARTMARQFFYAAFADLYWRAMMKSSDATLAAIAAKSEKESAYHLRHSSEWMVRLGDGTAESHRRAQAAVEDLWAYTGEMFDVDESERALIDDGVAVDPATLHSQWQKTVSSVMSEATLALPTSGWMQQGGRSGKHSEHLGHLLSELQSMQRTFPGAAW